MEDQSVLITGVSSGIGFGLTAEYLRRGYHVYGLSRREPSDFKANPHFRFERIDLREPAAVTAGLDRLLREVGRLELVVLNAGILGPFGDLVQTSLQETKAVFDTNLWPNKAVLDFLFNRGVSLGQVVTISSGAAVNGNRGWGGYSISKAALNMMTMLYSREMPETHFCALAPGLVDTAMQDELCGMTPDPRFPALDAIRSKRHTSAMPTPEAFAGRLANTIQRLPKLVESGEFADIRNIAP